MAYIFSVAPIESSAAPKIDPRGDLVDEILRLKKERNAVILAHFYQESEIQDLADYVEDSLGLARRAQKTNADVIAFAERERAPGIRIDAVVREGNTAGEVLEHATGMKPDLLVIGTHGRSGFERLLLGSVAEKVLRKASCPVMTVPRVPDAVPIGPVLFRRILCPVDFSASSLHALEYAMSMAQETGGELTALHVISHEFESVPNLTEIGYDATKTIGDLLTEREDDLRKRLHEAVAGAPGSCRVESLMTHGKPWREVLRVADEKQYDLIVMGVHGRGAADLLFFGSTTQHVVRAASCPVLTLRPG